MPPTTLLPSFCEVYDYPLLVQAAVIAALFTALLGILRVRLGRVPERTPPTGPRPPRDAAPLASAGANTPDFAGIFGVGAPMQGPPPSPARLEPEALVERWEAPPTDD